MPAPFMRRGGQLDHAGFGRAEGRSTPGAAEVRVERQRETILRPGRGDIAGPDTATMQSSDSRERADSVVPQCSSGHALLAAGIHYLEEIHR